MRLLAAARLCHVQARRGRREDDHGDGPGRQPQKLLTTKGSSREGSRSDRLLHPTVRNVKCGDLHRSEREPLTRRCAGPLRVGG
jgi:hypothetical protein